MTPGQSPDPPLASTPPSDSTFNSGRTIAWPLIVGGGVLAVAWTAWQIASGKPAVDSISTAASGLAAFAVAVVCVTTFMDLLIRLAGTFFDQHPRFLDLDRLVPLAAIMGFGLGWVVWK